MLTTHQPQGDEAALGQPHWGLDHQTTVYKESLWSTLQVAGSSSLQGHLAIAWPQDCFAYSHRWAHRPKQMTSAIGLRTRPTLWGPVVP